MSVRRVIAFILLVFLLASSVFFVIFSSGSGNEAVFGQVGTSVGGTFLGDTVWTPSGSPYNFVSDVIVSPDSSLTIAPGTVVNLGVSAFIIDGSLYARGNSGNRIVFEAQNRTTRSWPPRIFFNDSSTSWHENTGTGCIIDYALVNVPNWQYETIMGAYPKISNNIIYNYGGDAAAVRVNGLVVNNTILGGYRGIVAQFNDTILSNTIKDAAVGISCGYMSFDPIYHPTIIGNVLINNSIGIDDYGCAPYIANNTIASNKYGIYFTSYTFYGNAVPDGIIYNNLYNNNYNVLVGFTDSKNINMANNWWGTTDASKIAQSFYDNTTNSNPAKINYVPFLTQPNSQTTPVTPIATPAPTSTPSPTSPSPSPTLTLSCISSTTYATFSVEINGNLTFNGATLSAVPVAIYYSVAGTNSWQLLTGVYTSSDGSFSVGWHPSVTGNFLINATYPGNSTYSSISTVVNLAIMPFRAQNEQEVFSVASNSSVTDLAFNSASRELSFTVTGPSGSTGYADVYIDKSLIADISALTVNLDGDRQSFITASKSDSWVIHFTYHHSSHDVVMNLSRASAKPFFVTFETAFAVAIIAGLAVVVSVMFVVNERNQKPFR